MKKFLFIFTLFVFLNSCVSIPKNTTEDMTNSSFFPFIISLTEVRLNDIKYKMVGGQRRLRRSPIRKIDKYIYLIGFTLSIYDDLVWDQPFFINIIFSDGSSEYILYNDEGFSLTNAQFNEYVFTVEIERQQQIRITVGHYDENGYEILDFDNPFKSKFIELN